MNRTRRFAAAFVVVALALLAVPGFAAESKGVVNLNTASASELALLPRVGPAVASRIVEHREKNGNFKKVDELLLVRGIGEKTLALIEPYVTVSGPTTLKEKVRSPRSQQAAAPSEE